MTKPRRPFGFSAALAALAVLTVFVAPGSTGSPRATPTATLHRDGRWLVDSQGRVVILHGVNAVWKRAPYVPPATAAGFTAADADWLAGQGFTSVRLGVLFEGVMPAPGRIDATYLAKVGRVVHLLSARHIWVLLDFHQDLYTERYAGEGFPDWATHDDGLPHTVNAGFPGNYFLPATMRAFDRFWLDSDGVQEQYAAAWRAVANHFRTTPYLLGYDLMNEPWPGTSWASCANPVGCPVFDAHLLAPMYRKVTTAIRAVDRTHLVWVEPNVLFNDGAQTQLGALAPLGDPLLGLSFHQYCTTAGLTHSHGGTAGPDCAPQGELVGRNADSSTTTLGVTELLTEFGASDDLADVARVAALADEHLFGWEYWHYKEWSDPTTESQGSGGQGLFTNDADLRSLKQAKADLLIRPYASAVAGLPTAMQFDPATGVFTLAYGARARTGLTEVILPRRHYPRGYRVSVTGARVTSAPGAAILLLRADRDGPVAVRVQPV